MTKTSKYEVTRVLIPKSKHLKYEREKSNIFILTCIELKALGIDISSPLTVI